MANSTRATVSVALSLAFFAPAAASSERIANETQIWPSLSLVDPAQQEGPMTLDEVSRYLEGIESVDPKQNTGPYKLVRKCWYVIIDPCERTGRTATGFCDAGTRAFVNSYNALNRVIRSFGWCT